MKILAIDIGGTKSALGLFDLDLSTAGGRVQLVSDVTNFVSRDFHSLVDMIRDWQSHHPDLRFDAIGAGVAGPVKNDRVRLTNLGWDIDASVISSTINKPFRLCNDLRAHGLGVLRLTGDKLITLNSGDPAPGPKALIAAGTGLGEAIIGWDGQRHSPMAGEGGHASFSPTNDLEDELSRFLRRELGGHVSWERVLGGLDGFRNLARFLSIHKKSKLPEYLSSLGDHPGDWGAAIVGANDTFAANVLALYCTLYGREAANLALKCLPTDGLYIGGGIAPRILPHLQKHFMTGFTEKGRFSALLSSIPVYVVTDPLNGLKGAAAQI